MTSTRKQNGIVLFIALIVLIAMSLAGIALWRSIGTGVLIAGNVAMQRGAASSSASGIEAARIWLMGQPPNILVSDQLAQGYISNWVESFDAPRFDWGGSSKLVGTDAAGFTVRYVVHRMCKNPNAPVDAAECLTLFEAGGNTNRGGTDYTNRDASGKISVYFRITSRAVGPRNAVSYTQSIIY